MLLAIDTATRWTGLALHDGTAVLMESGWYSTHTQTIELAPAVAALLQRTDVAAADLQGIAVAIGPGSYTGLRIGLSLAKGMALAHSVALIGIPTLDILATALPQMSGNLVVVAEAGRSRVCAGLYRWQTRGAKSRKTTVEGWLAVDQPTIESWPDLVAKTAAGAIFAGEINSEAARLIRAADKKLQMVAPAASVRRAGYLAEIGWQRLRKGQLDSKTSLAPIYLREPGG
jgi:tRNA threonylcarbamoyladenosine biosynthesis protein TsaB